MSNFFKSPTFFGLFFYGAGAVLTATAPVDSLQVSLSPPLRTVDIYDEKQYAIVQVEAIANDPQKKDEKVRNIASGFFISREGHLITSDFIIPEAQEVWVKCSHPGSLPETYYPAEIVGSDARTRIAILKVKVPPKISFPFISFPERNDLPKVGSDVLALFYQMGLNVTPAKGMVTGHNSTYGLNFEQKLPTTHVRTNVDAVGGEIGGAVLDADGNLLGAIVFSLPGIRSSFVLPLRALRRVRDDILLQKTVNYAYFGVEIKPEWDIHKKSLVVAVDRLLPDSPAQKAGLKEGDVLLQIADTVVKSWDDVINAFFFARPNAYTTFKVLRGKQQKEISVRPTVHVRPETIACPSNEAKKEPAK